MLFNYDNKESLKQTYRETWSDFRFKLGVEQVDYTDINKIKESGFLAVLDDALKYKNNSNTLKVYSNELTNDYIFCRATILGEEESEKDIPKERFLPKYEFIKEDNRFSPKGVEYLYLACKRTNDKSDGEYNIPKTIALREIRPLKGQRVAICKFNISTLNQFNQVYNVIDLTLADQWSLDEIVEIFDVKISKLLYGPKGSNSNRKKCRKQLINDMCLLLYMKLLSSEIFKPVEGAKKEAEYAPFHCLAEYFKSLGFDGIIYSSTVYEGVEGKNLVLFNKELGIPGEYCVEVQ